MALGKYSRVDGRSSSSSYFSTVSLVVFVALCLVGVWMLTSSSVVPVQNVDVSAQEAKDEVKEQASEISESSVIVNTENNPTKFEDSSGDVSDEATKGDRNVSSGQEENTRTQETTGSGQEENTSTQETTDSGQEENTSTPETTGSGQEENTSTQETTGSGQEENPSTQETTGSGQEENTSTQETTSSGHQEEKTSTQETTDDLGKANENAGEKKQEDNSVKESPKEGKASEEAPKTEPKNSGAGETRSDVNNKTKGNSEDGSNEKKSDSNQTGKKSEDNGSKTQNADGSSNEVLPTGVQPELLNETATGNGGWKTQATESNNEKETTAAEYKWKLCNVTAGPDYIPCLDNVKAIKELRSTKHYEHRERHCPEVPPTCLVALPEGYQRSIEWPTSREKIWYQNVPHTKLAEVKGHQNWVKVSGNYLTFPGGGTQFKHGALHYIDFIQESVSAIAWGKQTRVILDVGCGVASFGGFLFDRDVLTMSFAPKDEHEAQVQFALERGIPGISAVMGTTRLPFPGRVFDAVHCARCRVPWHIEGGKLLLELNRVLRPGGHFLWSATPIYKNYTEDAGIWEAMKQLTTAMCWELVSVKKDKVNGVAVAIYRKPMTNECYQKRLKNEPPVCPDSDDPNAAWNVRLQACMHQIPTEATERGSKWPEQWSDRLTKSPYWLLSSNVGVYGKPAPEDFTADSAHWKRVVDNSYLKGMGINWSTVRNVMDMKAIYGGFAAALKDLNVWVMNVVPIDSPDTLPVIYERGLFGIYHDWCESFNTYPRSYDLLHADHLFSQISKKCNMLGAVAETDRILRPEGKLIIRDKVDTINELEGLFKAMHWEIRLTYTKDGERLLLVQKTMWRPTESETITYAIV